MTADIVARWAIGSTVADEVEDYLKQDPQRGNANTLMIAVDILTEQGHLDRVDGTRVGSHLYGFVRP